MSEPVAPADTVPREPAGQEQSGAEQVLQNTGPIPGVPEAFRVRCPDCGPQVIAVSEVRYVETGADASSNRYVFACPECGTRVRRPAGPELSEILRSSGVATLALHRGPGEAV